MKIPVCEPFISGREMEYVADCLHSNWISSKGRYIDLFEEEFSRYCGCCYGISTTNGTVALHLALASLGIGQGDEVVIPAFTMIATAFAVAYVGAKPVLVDCERDTWNMDVAGIEEKITSRTRAILPVHIYGHPCDMESIMHVAGKHDLFVVEDAAEAHGAEVNGSKAGGIGDIGCFSFYANKIITTGEGGMVVTNDHEVAERARRLKDLAFSTDRRFIHSELGFNFRMTNVQAAIGLAQLEKIEGYVERRRKNAELYNGLLEGVAGITLPVQRHWAKNVYWMYAVLVEDDFALGRDDLMLRLAERGVETRPFFMPMNRQPVFRNMGLFGNERYPVAEEISEKGLYLPSGSGLEQEQIEYVCSQIIECSRARPQGNA